MTPRQFETALRVRRHRRDEIRRFVAKVLAEGRAMEERIGQIDAARAESTAALQAATTHGRVNIDRAAALRHHAMRLSFERTYLAQQAASHAERLKATQAVLAKADKDVKAVERLRERYAALRRLESERRADREATDRYSALRASNVSSSDQAEDASDTEIG